MGATPLWECPLVEERDPFSADDLPVLLDMLFDHRMGVIQDFLRGKKQPFTGDKDHLRNRVTNYVRDNVVKGEELIGLLDHVEGGGTSTSTYIDRPTHWSGPGTPRKRPWPS